MPYIDPQDRIELNRTPLEEIRPLTKGQLTYCIFKLQRQFADYHGVSYAVLSEAVDAAVDAGHEFRRRHLDSYEDRKRDLNGDVT